MKFNLIECEDDDLDQLYSESALSFEGTTIDDDNLEYLVNWLKEHDCEMIKPDFYVIKGYLMNTKYHLTGSNQYPNDCNILCIKLNNLTNPQAIYLPRFELGGRWFDDIVSNNAAREERN